MSDNRFAVKTLPGDLIRVVDTEEERVEGVWNQRNKTWFNIRAFLDDA